MPDLVAVATEILRVAWDLPAVETDDPRVLLDDLRTRFVDRIVACSLGGPITTAA